MKPIKTEFSREGFLYRQIWRQKDVAVYEYGNPSRYELIIIREEPEEILPSGSVLPLRESYPPTSQWGKYGWSLGSEDRLFAIHIGEQIAELPSEKRVSKVHSIMNHWLATRRLLKSGKAKPT